MYPAPWQAKGKSVVTLQGSHNMDLSNVHGFPLEYLDSRLATIWQDTKQGFYSFYPLLFDPV